MIPKNKCCSIIFNYINDNANGIIICKQCGCIQNTIFSQEIKKNLTFKKINHRSPLNWDMFSYKERIIMKIQSYYRNICEKYNIYKIVEDTAVFFCKQVITCIKRDGSIVIRGKNRKGVIAAIFNIACNNNGDYRPYNEIAKMFCLEKKIITRGFNKLNKLNFKLDNLIVCDNYLNRICFELGLNNKYIKKINIIKNNFQKFNLLSNERTQSFVGLCIIIFFKKYNKNIPDILFDKLFITKTIIQKYNSLDKNIINLLLNNKLAENLYNHMNKKTQNLCVPTEVQLLMNKFNINIDDLEK